MGPLPARRPQRHGGARGGAYARNRAARAAPPAFPRPSSHCAHPGDEGSRLAEKKRLGVSLLDYHNYKLIWLESSHNTQKSFHGRPRGIAVGGRGYGTSLLSLSPLKSSHVCPGSRSFTDGWLHQDTRSLTSWS